MNTKDGQNGSFAFNWVLNQGRQVGTQKQSTGQTSWKITHTFQRGSVCERWGEITCQLWGFGRDYSRKTSSGRGILPAFYRKNNLNKSREARTFRAHLGEQYIRFITVTYIFGNNAYRLFAVSYKQTPHVCILVGI